MNEGIQNFTIPKILSINENNLVLNFTSGPSWNFPNVHDVLIKFSGRVSNLS